MAIRCGGRTIPDSIFSGDWVWQGLSAFDNIDFFGIFLTYLYYAMRLKTKCIKLQRMENRTQKNHPSLFFSQKAGRTSGPDRRVGHSLLERHSGAVQPWGQWVKAQLAIALEDHQYDVITLWGFRRYKAYYKHLFGNCESQLSINCPTIAMTRTLVSASRHLRHSSNWVLNSRHRRYRNVP